MKTWNVRVGVRYAKDYIIEAETKTKARGIAESEMMIDSALDNINGWEFTNDDYDVWEI